MRDAGHRQVDHTADLALELWAPDEGALLVEAARALVGVLTEGAAVARRDTRALALSALDPEDRLVRFMNEVLFLAIAEGFLVADAELALRDDGLDARLWGEAGAGARLRTELKAVTYHALALRLDADAGRAWARVVIDV